MNNGHAEKALERFNSGYNCSQSVFSVYAEEEGMNEESSRAIASAFGGGIAHMQYTCGALTGAIMAIGLHFARGKDALPKEEIYRKSRRFLSKFKELHGSSDCLELLGYDFYELNEQTAIERTKVHEKCNNYIEDACRLLDELFAQGT